MAVCFYKSSYFTCLQLLMCLLLIGCTPENTDLEQFRRENPFRSPHNNDYDRIFLVTCNYLALEIPAHLDIQKLDIWQDFGMTGADDDDANPASLSIKQGFTPETFTALRNNGFLIAMAPALEWQRFLEELQPAEELRPLRDQVAVFRHAAQVADLPAYPIENQRPVFINDGGAIRGFSLEQGRCFWRLNCVPENRDEQSLFIKLTPGFQALEPRVFIDADNQDFISETSEVVFNELSLKGILKSDTLLMLACDTEKTTTNNIARIFLTDVRQSRHTQLVFLLIPRVLTAEEVDRPVP